VEFLAFLDESERRFANRTSAADWVEIVEFYSTDVRRLVAHTSSELQVRGMPGFWSKLAALDCLLAAQVSRSICSTIRNLLLSRLKKVFVTFYALP